MMNNLLLKNGRIIDPANQRDERGNIYIANGKIQTIGNSTTIPEGTREVDCTGYWIMPGLIDMHVHLREPGEEYKETIESGCMAAAAGGFTAVACMPNTKPVNDDQSITATILNRARHAAARVYPVGAISKGSLGQKLAEYGELKEAGAVAVSDDGLPVTNSQLMRRALEYAGNFNMLVISHAEELSLCSGGSMNEGALATRLGLGGIPTAAEAIMVYRDVMLCKYLNKRLHIAHISTAEAVDIIRRAKAQGAPISAETAPHYFTLTEEAVIGYNTAAKMNPPLRSEEDVIAIRKGLADGTLDVIATDHAPHSVLEKDVEFDQAANGIIGLETAVPLTLNLIREKVLTATDMVNLLSVRPANILNVAGGSLHEGAVADITVIDPEKEFIFTREMIQSKGKNSPFLGKKLQGKAILTMVGGEVKYTDS